VLNSDIFISHCNNYFTEEASNEMRATATLTLHVTWSVCLSVTPWVPQKRLNRLRCRVRRWEGAGPKPPVCEKVVLSRRVNGSVNCEFYTPLTCSYSL